MALPLLGPIIIAAGTQWITSSFQRRAAEIATKNAHMEADMAQAAKIYDEVSKTLDALHYFMIDEAVYGIIRKARNLPPATTDEANWAAYLSALAVWKTSQNRLLAEVEVYFGVEAAKALEEIARALGKGEKILGATCYDTEHSMAKVESVVNAEDKYHAMKDFFFKTNCMDNLKNQIRALNVIMMSSRQSGRIGKVHI